MKFIEEFDIELVNQALQFDTADCRVQGGCDLFSTRPAGSDKKLYKTIDSHLNTLLQESASIQANPPKQNPYYPRSYSSTHYGSPQSRGGSVGSYTETRRRNSDGLSRLALQAPADIKANNSAPPEGTARKSTARKSTVQDSKPQSSVAAISTPIFTDENTDGNTKGNTASGHADPGQPQQNCPGVSSSASLNSSSLKSASLNSSSSSPQSSATVLQLHEENAPQSSDHAFKEPKRKTKRSNLRKLSNDFAKPINLPKPRRSSAAQSASSLQSSTHDATEPSTPQGKVYDLINQSPFGPLSNTGSRRVFAYLIGVLNSTYPDHDFSLLEPADFIRVTPFELMDKFNNTLISLGKLPMEWVWDTLRAHIGLYECSVYFYTPAESFLEDEPGSLWSMMWFIFNKKKRRVAYLYLNAIQRSVPLRSSYYLGSAGKRRKSITIDDDDEDSYDEFNYSGGEYDYEEEALMSDIDEEYS